MALQEFCDLTDPEARVKVENDLLKVRGKPLQFLSSWYDDGWMQCLVHNGKSPELALRSRLRGVMCKVLSFGDLGPAFVYRL